jgi:glycosyltransferase involved in cell wall biosynthesis
MPEPVRIVRVIARMNVGGPARQAIELSRGLASYGYETVLCTGESAAWEGDLRDEARRSGINIFTIPGLTPAIKPASDARALFALASLLRRVRPQLVHTHTAKAGVLGRLASRLAGTGRRVHTFHGTVFNQYFSKGAGRWIVRVERALARSTDRIVAVSHAVADELESAGIPAQKIRVIPPVIDLDPYLSIRGGHLGFMARCGAAGGAPLIGWVGRFVAIKDPDCFVEAVALLQSALPEARFVMVGSGPLLGATQQKARDLRVDSRITFLPFQASMTDVYGGIDLLVSTSRKEGMPVVVLEGAAAGVPAVATEVGGSPELIAADRSGFLVPPGSPDAVAKAVARYFDLPPGDRLAMRGVARVRARERYGLRAGLERHAQMYEEILHGN